MGWGSGSPVFSAVAGMLGPGWADPSGFAMFGQSSKKRHCDAGGKGGATKSRLNLDLSLLF